MVTSEMIHQAKLTTHDYVLAKWLAEDVFSPKWWGFVVLIAISYILCFSLLDKRRYTQILLFGSLMAVASVVISIFGSNFDLWSYHSRLVPTIPSPFVYDLTIIPLYYMLVYQYSPGWKAFLIWNGLTAGIIAFGYFPALAALKIVSLKNWSYFGFFAVNFTVALIARAVVLAVLASEKKGAAGYLTEAPPTRVLQPAMKPLGKEPPPEDD